MKKMLWVLAIVLALLCGATYLETTLRNDMVGFQQDLGMLEKSMQEGAREEALNRLLELSARWQERREYWELFIDHRDIDNAELSLATLATYVEGDAPEPFWRGEIARMQRYCDHLSEQTRLAWGRLL
nr:DUF4363 family protein [Maliibacterium massiliense]